MATGTPSGKGRKRTASGTTGIPAEVVSAWVEVFTDQPVGFSDGPDDPAPTKGVAGTTAYQLRLALAEAGIYTAGWTDPGPGATYFYGLRVISEEDYTSAVEARKASREAKRLAAVAAQEAEEAAEVETVEDLEVEGDDQPEAEVEDLAA